MREKLIDVFCAVLGAEPDYRNEEAIHFVDELIASGVTVGEPLAEFLHPVDDYRGLKAKYLVFKADTGERVADCFVLRPAKDHAAVEALRAYANATDNETLAEDIHNWVGKGVTVQKWVPVTERLPEESRYYLCYWDGHTRLCKYWRQYKRFEFNGREAKVTHWMPLPEPPKGE